MDQLSQLPTESVVSVRGCVQSRPQQDRNSVSYLMPFQQQILFSITLSTGHVNWGC